MTETCPACGAVLPEGGSCQTIFDSFLALEFSDPEYGAVHFLTVACFMVQHGRYSDAALAWIEEKLRAYLEEGQGTEQIRREATREAGPGARAWKVLRGKDEPPQARVAWTVTIADVAAHDEDAASYREWVIGWGKATLREMQALKPR